MNTYLEEVGTLNLDGGFKKLAKRDMFSGYLTSAWVVVCKHRRGSSFREQACIMVLLLNVLGMLPAQRITSAEKTSRNFRSTAAIHTP